MLCYSLPPYTQGKPWFNSKNTRPWLRRCTLCISNSITHSSASVSLCQMLKMEKHTYMCKVFCIGQLSTDWATRRTFDSFYAICKLDINWINLINWIYGNWLLIRRLCRARVQLRVGISNITFFSLSTSKHLWSFCSYGEQTKINNGAEVGSSNLPDIF